MKALYTAVATATDQGRNGHVSTDDGKLDLEMSMPERMGGPGGDGTNPEQLFAAGYAACFANAMRSVARREERESVVDGATLTAEVDIGRSGPGGKFGLAVRLKANVARAPAGRCRGARRRGARALPVLQRDAGQHRRGHRGHRRADRPS